MRVIMRKSSGPSALPAALPLPLPLRFDPAVTSVPLVTTIVDSTVRSVVVTPPRHAGAGPARLHSTLAADFTRQASCGKGPKPALPCPTLGNALTHSRQPLAF
jgi:hypothetical protein